MFDRGDPARSAKRTQGRVCFSRIRYSRTLTTDGRPYGLRLSGEDDRSWRVWIRAAVGAWRGTFDSRLVVRAKHRRRHGVLGDDAGHACADGKAVLRRTRQPATFRAVAARTVDPRHCRMHLVRHRGILHGSRHGHHRCERSDAKGEDDNQNQNATELKHATGMIGPGSSRAKRIARRKMTHVQELIGLSR